jgi:hypothetical protein
MRSFLISIGTWCLISSSPIYGEVQDIGSLFPSETQLYIEICQSKDFVSQLRQMVKGSSIENALPHLQKYRGSNGFADLGDLFEPGILSMIFSPEMLKEASRFQGFAYGLSEAKKLKKTEWQAILLVGDSQVPGILFRGFLGGNSNLQKSGTVDGIDIYEGRSYRTRNIYLEPIISLPFSPYYYPTPNPGTSYAIASTPEALIFASGKEAITKAIKRLKGKDKENLLSSPAMKQIRELRKKPGIVWFARPSMILNHLTLKDKEDISTYWGELSRQWMLAESFGTCFGSFSLPESRLDLLIHLPLDVTKKTPLSLLLGHQGIDSSTLESIPIEQPIGWTIACPKEETDWQKFLQLADSLVKASGSLSVTPSEALEEIGQKQRMDFRKDLAPKFQDFSFFWGATKQGFVPVFRLRMSDNSSAQKAEKYLLDFLELIGGDAKDRVVETIDGQSIYSLPLRGNSNLSSTHFARKENILLLGFDRKLISDLLNSKREQTLKTVEGYSHLFQPKSSYSIIGTLHSGNLIKTILAAPSANETHKKTENRGVNPGKRTSIEEAREVLIRGDLNQIGNTASKLPPTLFTLTGEKNTITIQICQPVESKHLARIIDQTLEWYAKRSSNRRSPSQLINYDLQKLLIPPFGP